MKNYDSTIQATTFETPTPGAAAEVWNVLVFATGGSLSIILGGAVFLLAVDMLHWERLRLFVIVAAVPWVLVGALLIIATYQQSVALLERLTGRDLDGSGEIGDIPDIRIVPYRGPSHTVGGCVPDDLRYFVRTIVATGDWTQKTWRGKQLPSGQKCDNDYHAKLCAVLQRIGIIVGAGPRVSGTLTTTDVGEILDLLGLNGELN